MKLSRLARDAFFATTAAAVAAWPPYLLELYVEEDNDEDEDMYDAARCDGWYAAWLAPSCWADGTRPCPSPWCAVPGLGTGMTRGTGRGRDEPTVVGVLPGPGIFVGEPARLTLGPRLLPRGARFVWTEVASPRRGRLLGTDCELPRVDAGRTAGVTTPDLPCPDVEGARWLVVFGVVARGGTDPARPFVRLFAFSLSAALTVSMRNWSMLIP